MKVLSYSVASAIKGVCKQSAIWGEFGHCSSPLVYLQRPKWIKDDAAWQKIVDSIRLELPASADIE